MSLYDDIHPYLDKDTGLLLPPSGGKDNLILYSAYLLRELEAKGERTAELTVWNSCVTFLTGSRVAPGLYLRAPGDKDDNSVDNMIGACFVSSSVASDILSRWNSRFACFDVNRPSWIGIGKNWYGRFVGLKPYIKACAGEEVTWWDTIIWSLACIWSTYRSKGASDPLLQSLQNDKMPGCVFAKRLWNKKYSVKALYATYFGTDFPLSKDSK